MSRRRAELEAIPERKSAPQRVAGILAEAEQLHDQLTRAQTLAEDLGEGQLAVRAGAALGATGEVLAVVRRLQAVLERGAPPAAWAQRKPANRAKARPAAAGDSPSPSGHGTRACYVRGCRRAECRLANAQYQRDAKDKKAGRAPGRKAKPAVDADGMDLEREDPALAAQVEEVGDLLEEQDDLEAMRQVGENEAKLRPAEPRRRRGRGRKGSASAVVATRAAGVPVCGLARNFLCEGRLFEVACGDCDFRAHRCKEHAGGLGAAKVVEAHQRGMHGTKVNTSPGQGKDPDRVEKQAELGATTDRVKKIAEMADRRLWWRGSVRLYCRKCTAYVAGDGAIDHLETTHADEVKDAVTARRTWPFVMKGVEADPNVTRGRKTRVTRGRKTREDLGLEEEDIDAA